MEPLLPASMCETCASSEQSRMKMKTKSNKAFENICFEKRRFRTTCRSFFADVQSIEKRPFIHNAWWTTKGTWERGIINDLAASLLRKTRNSFYPLISNDFLCLHHLKRTSHPLSLLFIRKEMSRTRVSLSSSIPNKLTNSYNSSFIYPKVLFSLHKSLPVWYFATRRLELKKIRAIEK